MALLVIAILIITAICGGIWSAVGLAILGFVVIVILSLANPKKKQRIVAFYDDNGKHLDY